MSASFIADGLQTLVSDSVAMLYPYDSFDGSGNVKVQWPVGDLPSLVSVL